MEINLTTSCSAELPLAFKLALVAMAALPLFAWASYFFQFRRPDHGAWKGSAPLLMALAPAWMGVAVASLGLGNVMAGLEKSSGGIHSAAAGVAEALSLLVVGIGASALVVLTTYIWVARLPKSSGAPTARRVVAPSAIAAISLALISVIVTGYWIPYTVASSFVTSGALHAGALSSALFAVGFAVAAYLPGWAAASKREQAVLTFASFIMLCVAGTTAYIIVQRFYLLAIGRLT